MGYDAKFSVCVTRTTRARRFPGVMRSSSDWVRTRSGEWRKAQVQQTRGLNRTEGKTYLVQDADIMHILAGH